MWYDRGVPQLGKTFQQERLRDREQCGQPITGMAGFAGAYPTHEHSHTSADLAASPCAGSCNSSCIKCRTNFGDGSLWALEMRIVPQAGKNNELDLGFISELNSHLFVDIKIFLTPNDGGGRFEPVQIGLKIVLVPSEM